MTDNDKKIGIHELYANDAERADELLWGRKVNPSNRRGFLRKSGLAAMVTLLGYAIPFSGKMPGGLIPAALADSLEAFSIAGKEGLRVLNDRPINAETPPHLLDDDFTPAKHFFVRNNGIPPALESMGKTSEWALEITGESCVNPMTFSLAELKAKFPVHTYALTLECGGNGRSEFDPPARGNQWSTGAVGCAKWTGIRLRDVLAHCGIAEDAVYIGYYGADAHLSGDPAKHAISRGVPLAKAREAETLIAWGFNGDDIPYQNGYPLRLVVGGWPASTCGKWLNKIAIRNQIHYGAKMAPPSYSVPCKGVAPGTKVAGEDMCIIESMPVKSLVTLPQSGITHLLGKPLHCRGHAWAGDLSVSAVDVSTDFGATWQPAKVKDPVNRLAWQRWSTTVNFEQPGYYEVWARATDSSGSSQPMVVPGWNPKGYLNNACHRIAVQIV
ncbi:MAG: DMSO/TMAO reductase YedYZ molybdopterin-dependent catalytic subunit [Halieaceae bacterium]